MSGVSQHLRGGLRRRSSTDRSLELGGDAIDGAVGYDAAVGNYYGAVA